jgi:uncharacterized protein
MPRRVIVTAEAAALIRQLMRQHGSLIFHQSGGCCEGTAPMCFRRRDFRIGPHDVLLGAIEGCPFYVGGAAFSYWAYMELTIDVVTGGSDSFSLEAAEGVRFVTRSRLFTDAEAAALDACGPPPRGPLAMATMNLDGD